VPAGRQRGRGHHRRGHPKDGDRIVTHQRVGGFADSDLEATLRAAGAHRRHRRRGHQSVEGTARAASDLGFRTVVVADA
jgi:nicotinamidase-related amidase